MASSPVCWLLRVLRNSAFKSVRLIVRQSPPRISGVRVFVSVWECLRLASQQQSVVNVLTCWPFFVQRLNVFVSLINEGSMRRLYAFTYDHTVLFQTQFY